MTTQPVPTDVASPSVVYSPPIVTTRNAIDSDALVGVEAFSYAFVAVVALYFLGRYRVKRFLYKSRRSSEDRPETSDARNPFEAGRRIALAIQTVALVLGIGAVVITYLSTQPRVYIQTNSPDDSWALMRGDCSYEAASELRSNFELPGGRTVRRLTFCFQPMFGNEGIGVPYERADEEGAYWLENQFSSPVTDYTRSRVNSFYPGQELADEIHSRSRDLIRRNTMQAVYIAAIAVGAFWIGIWGITFGIGWIIRGSRGIPLGSDYAAPARNGPAASSEESGDGLGFK